MSKLRRILIDEWNHCNKHNCPKLITFDAYNTLYSPRLPVMEQYALVANKYGIDKNPNELAAKFPHIYATLQKEHPQFGKTTNISAFEWWCLLVRRVYEPLSVPHQMITEIVTRFESSEAFTVYSDVLQLLYDLHTRFPDTILGIVSNTDPQIYSLLHNLGLDQYFSRDNIYLSCEIGLTKPSPDVFDYVLKDVVNRNTIFHGIDINELRPNCWHIGDELVNDLEAASNAGWTAILVDRYDKYGFAVNDCAKRSRNAYKLAIDKLDSAFSESSSQAPSDSIVTQLHKRQLVVKNLDIVRKMLD